MQIELRVLCNSAEELAVISNVLYAVLDGEDVDALLGSVADDANAAASTEVGTSPCPPAEPKKRGRKPKDKPDAVKGAAVLDQLKESIEATTPKDNVVALVQPDTALPDAAPPAAPAPEVGTITTGQQLQEYILSLVHQKRLDPVAVKATVYPKYGVIRSLDLKPEQVAAAKADVDAMLKGGPAPVKNDLDL